MGLVVGKQDDGVTALTEDGLNVVLTELDKGGDSGDFHPGAESGMAVLTVEMYGGSIELSED